LIFTALGRNAVIRAGWIAIGLVGTGGFAHGAFPGGSATPSDRSAAALAQAAEHAAPLGQRSLAPLDVEAFRQRYGQQPLFRLRLGADAAFAASAGGSACAGFVADWLRSPQHGEFERALSAEQPFLAGQALGRWQRLASQCR